MIHVHRRAASQRVAVHRERLSHSKRLLTPPPNWFPFCNGWFLIFKLYRVLSSDSGGLPIINTQSQSQTGSPGDHLPPEPPRRQTLKAALAIFFGGLLPLGPLAAGLAVVLNPLRGEARRKSLPTGSDEKGFFKLAALNELPVGEPRLVKLVATVTDAWNKIPDQPIGACFITRQTDGTVTALSSTCPHAGCIVDYRPGTNEFHCPCHNSAFAVSGQRTESSPSARDLDTLDCEVRGETVWVKYQDFKTGHKEKIPNA